MKARSRVSLATVAMLIALVVMSVVLPAAAQPTRQFGRVTSNEPAATAPSVEQVDQIVANSVRRPGGLIQVIVTLNGAPAVEQFVAAGGTAVRGMAQAAAATRAAELDVAQNAFVSAASAVGAVEINRHNFLTNTVTLAVRPEQVRALYTLPGVVKVSADRIYTRQDTTSVPLIGAPAAWASTPTAFTGEGVKVAIIDTGIDYTHTHFGGPGDYADAGDTTDAADGAVGLFPAAFPIAAQGDPKVIGGYDFVGDAYDANIVGSLPVPDGDPVDCPVADGGGHGSHVAGSAAGWGVNSDGTTYAGALNASIYSSYPAVTTALRIGPGVAPEAALIAIRVFGCDGSVNTDVLLDAIESAVTGDFPGATGDVAGGADVINMSLGSSYGGAFDDDPLVAAQEAATDAGVIIVDSAGNSGNITLITGSPGSANSVISVASTTDSSAVGDATVTQNNGLGAPAKFAATPGAANNANAIPFTGNVVATVPADACSTITNTAEVAGNIALIIRGGACPIGFVDKQNNAFAAGAAAVLVYNQPANGDNPVNMSGDGVVPGYNLPTYHVGQTAGLALLAAIADAAPTPISITLGYGDPNVGSPETPDQISSFSSRGGVVRSVGDLTVKPNVAAPGNTIVSARAGTGDQFYVIGGTSMASPHVAGVAALLRQQHPTLSVAQIKALIMNTANANIGTHPVQRVGSGRVDVADAIIADVIAYATDNPENVALSFGYPKVLAGGTPATFTKSVTLQNLSTTELTFGVSYVGQSNMAGVEFTVSPASIVVPASGTATVDVTLTVDTSVTTPNVITYAFDTSTANTTFLTEESGLLVFTEGSQPELRVPVYAAPHVTSNISASLSINDSYPFPVIDLSGTGVDTSGIGNGGSAIVSLASAFELVADDGVDAPAVFSPRPGDEYAQDDNAGDIDKVGITSDGPYVDAASLDPDDLLDVLDAHSAYVAISTFNEWTTPRDVEFDIYMDIDFDGLADWVIYNSSGSARPNGFEALAVDLNGWFGDPGLAYTYSAPLNGFFGSSLDTMQYKNNVMVITVPLWLTNDGTFNYWIESYTRDSDGSVASDAVGSEAAPFFYDGLNPTISFNDASGHFGPTSTGIPMWLSDDGWAIPVDIHPAANLNTLPDILVFHHHNQTPESRVQVLDTSEIVNAAGGFSLRTPANNSYVVDDASITSFTWDSVEGNFIDWRFVLTHISTHTRLGVVADWSGLTSDASDDALTCDATTCTLDASSLTFEDGQYTWTVTYTDGLNVVTEAANGPFFFTLETNDLNLLTNGGFEDCTGKVATGWTGSARCKVDAPNANSGSAYAIAKKGTLFTQKVTHPVVDQLIAGDTLDLGGWFNGKGTAKKVLMAVIKYDDNSLGTNGKAKVKVSLTTNTVGYEHLATSFVLEGSIKNIKVKLGSATAKVLADDLYLNTSGVNGAQGRGGAVDGILPPPAAPEGFRGTN